MELARASSALDAAADEVWFKEHPAIRERTRAASALEKAAFDLAPETVVHVRLPRDGVQVRSFDVPATTPAGRPTDRRPSQGGEDPGGGNGPRGSGS
jgi:hypothetical protein